VGRSLAYWTASGQALASGPSWATSSGQSLLDEAASTLGASTFNFTAIVRNNPGPVLYVPSVSEVLLDAWVKYLAVLVVVALVLDRGFCAFVFQYQLVDTYEHVEGGASKAGRAQGGSFLANRFRAHLA